MNNAIQREMLAADYASAIKRGDRAGAKQIWLRLFAVTNAMLDRR